MATLYKLPQAPDPGATTPPTASTPQKTLRLHRLLEVMTQVSKFGGLATGLGMLLFYLTGISLYVMGRSLFGVEPFEFELRGCLEAGALAITRLILVTPLLVAAGLPRLAQQGAGPLLVALGLMTLAGFLVRRSYGRLVALVVSLLFLLSLFMLIRGYIVNLPLLTSQNLLTDPGVNESIQRLAEGGLPALRGGTEAAGALSDLFASYVSALAVVFATWKLLARCRAIVPIANRRLLRLLRWESGALGVGGALYFLLGVLWFPASILLLQATGMHKVDVSITGLEDLTSKVYLVQYAEYQDSFVFYVPTQQSVLRVAKQNVRYLYLKEAVSPFSNSALFVKGPWIGFEYLPTWIDEAKTRKGLGILRLVTGAPAGRAGLRRGDIALSLNGMPLEGPEGLAAALKAAPLDRQSELVFLRKGRTERLDVQIELRP